MNFNDNQRDYTMNFNTITSPPRYNNNQPAKPTPFKAVQSYGQQQQRSQQCTFCGKEHSIIHCNFTPYERTIHLYEQERCIKCFQKGHWASNCNAEPCRICKKNHHTFVCFQHVTQTMKESAGSGQQHHDDRLNNTNRITITH